MPSQKSHATVVFSIGYLVRQSSAQDSLSSIASKCTLLRVAGLPAKRAGSGRIDDATTGSTKECESSTGELAARARVVLALAHGLGFSPVAGSAFAGPCNRQFQRCLER